MAAVNGTHRPPDALAPLMNVRSGAEGDKQTPNVTKWQVMVYLSYLWRAEAHVGGLYLLGCGRLSLMRYSCMRPCASVRPLGRLEPLHTSTTGPKSPFFYTTPVQVLSFTGKRKH